MVTFLRTPLVPLDLERRPWADRNVHGYQRMFWRVFMEGVGRGQGNAYAADIFASASGRHC